ncbi:hypothetical protein HanXRQr2_Chr15g0689871 [Helianthus annuus]|uniref:Uncharacterized protein n=1 Tax=Helianthus annuus TaxID=4232 RepID=A0A9K3E046_HELAN|nr:hypothetical protein HanXRQr2_Chr15g0689871 [Helianthus annuus]KAJ0830982.1 hypothetical protein HanPSC8_Chr15g0661731 [Helianthus annuus]
MCSCCSGVSCGSTPDGTKKAPFSNTSLSDDLQFQFFHSSSLALVLIDTCFR